MIASVLTVGASLAGLGPSAAADEALLQATPLILKDGRIASVSVHVLGFPQGEAVLDRADAQQLHVLSEEVATDCFLTAQVIGHVGSAEVAGRDTLNAHRLARARADAVQASLIEGGLPAKSIASVWDWQFMVRAPRATLWVFRLTPGEDCEDAPLDGAGSALVAQAEAAEPGPAGPMEPMTADRAEPPARTATIETADLAPPPAAVPEPVAARPAAQSPARAPTVTQALPAASPPPRGAAAAAEALPPTGVVAALPVQPEPAAEPFAAIRPAQAAPVQSAPAAIRPAATGPAVIASIAPPAAQPAASVAAAAGSTQEQLAIVFPTNSSYFPPGAGQQLRSLLRALAQDGAYQVVLRSSISGSQKVVGAESAEEAKRYNKWLAERRLERVRDWLGDNAAGRELTFTEDYSAGDESRQVEIEVRPAG